MPTIELTFTAPHINQRKIIDSSARFRVAACGRRFGKTTIGEHEIVLKALAGARCWWTAPTYKMTTDVWRDMKRLMRPMAACKISESERTIFFPGGGSISTRSTHEPKNLRGTGLDFIVLDEAAFMHVDIWSQIIRPMLVTTIGSALFLSSPFGRNHFWQLYNLGLDPLESEWESFHFTSYDNPLLSREELDSIERNTPERIWKEEYLAEFIDSSGQVFRNVRECAAAPPSAKPIPGHHYIIGIDWARDNDYTVIVVIDVTTAQMVFMDRFNQVGWAVQRGRVHEAYDYWRPENIYAESNSIGSVNIEALQAEGLPVRPFMTTAQSKMPLIESLALAFERGSLSILPDDVLVNELLSYRITRLPSNNWRYEAPPGGHDDTVIATALAWYGIAHAPGGAVDINW